MAKTKNEARTAWRAAEDEHRRLIELYATDQNPLTMDASALLAIDKARTAANRCLDAYVRRCLG